MKSRLESAILAIVSENISPSDFSKRFSVSLEYAESIIFPIQKLREEVRISIQVASESSDWLDNLVHDLSSELGCERNPSSVINSVKLLKAKCETLESIRDTMKSLVERYEKGER